MRHQNVKHAACATLRFGQERPQCDQSALRRFVGDGGAAVGPLKGGARELQPVAKNDAIDRSRKRLASFSPMRHQIRRDSKPATRIWGPNQSWFFGTPGFGTRL